MEPYPDVPDARSLLFALSVTPKGFGSRCARGVRDGALADRSPTTWQPPHLGSPAGGAADALRVSAGVQRTGRRSLPLRTLAGQVHRIAPAAIGDQQRPSSSCCVGIVSAGRASRGRLPALDTGHSARPTANTRRHDTAAPAGPQGIEVRVLRFHQGRVQLTESTVPHCGHATSKAVRRATATQYGATSSRPVRAATPADAATTKSAKVSSAARPPSGGVGGLSGFV